MCIRDSTKAGEEGLSADRLGLSVFKALGFERPGESGLRSEWLLDAELQGANFVNAQKAMRQVLAYRTWFDQRKGWRFTNPNLEQLGLVRVEYIGRCTRRAPNPIAPGWGW